MITPYKSKGEGPVFEATVFIEEALREYDRDDFIENVRITNPRVGLVFDEESEEFYSKVWEVIKLYEILVDLRKFRIILRKISKTLYKFHPGILIRATREEKDDTNLIVLYKIYIPLQMG